ncbi:Class I SAM-dependent methyltransferase [Azospirillaceae bacterium]
MPTDHSLAAPGETYHRLSETQEATDLTPAYLREIYGWAYLSPIGRAVFDHPLVVSAILWGNYHRLIRAVQKEISPGARMLQAASVYGNLSARLATTITSKGKLDIIDVAPIQVEHCRRKLKNYSHAHVFLGNAVSPPEGPYDVVCSFFLLHEVPEEYKHRIVDALLSRVTPGGKAVFIDYHKPKWWNPLRPIISLVFATLEPFASTLWRREIQSYASTQAEEFAWTKTTYFGGLYQKIIATRRSF